jgi:hypothetical protein
MDEDDFTPEERKGLRRMLREDEARRVREGQARAAALTKELLSKYGPVRGS